LFFSILQFHNFRKKGQENARGRKAKKQPIAKSSHQGTAASLRPAAPKVPRAAAVAAVVRRLKLAHGHQRAAVGIVEPPHAPRAAAAAAARVFPAFAVAAVAIFARYASGAATVLAAPPAAKAARKAPQD
jgi:hypothetical protein